MVIMVIPKIIPYESKGNPQLGAFNEDPKFMCVQVFMYSKPHFGA
jgi:hypothetical protein